MLKSNFFQIFLACVLVFSVGIIFGCALKKESVRNNLQSIKFYAFNYKTEMTIITTYNDRVAEINNYKVKASTEVFPVTGKEFTFISSETDKSKIESISIFNKDKSTDIIKIGDKVDKGWLMKLMHPYVLLNNKN